MSLVNRVSAFFLVALGVVLIALSASVYGVAHSYLFRQLSERLETALDVLEASVDVEPDGLEWEPLDRRIVLGQDPAAESIRWTVTDIAGHVVDRSGNCGSDFPFSWQPQSWPMNPPDGTAFGEWSGWWLGSRRLRLEELMQYGPRHVKDNSPDDDTDYPVLLLTVGASPLAVQAGLRDLAIALTTISLITWLICAVVGRWFCRRALEPVTKMAFAARQMTVSGSDGSLPVAATNDELEALGVSFNQLLDRLRASLEKQQRFAGDASHQLRTPLAGLLSLIDVIRRRERSVDEYVETLDKVRSEASRMNQIIESLLFLARTASSENAAAGEPMELQSWLPEQVHHWDNHPRAHDLHVKVSEDAPAWIRAQPALLSQLLAILIDNACKYSPAETPVEIAVAQRHGTVTISISDRGAGIADEDLPHVFDPFYRSETVRRKGRPGVGLGLAIARRIVESMGAVISVDSTVGVGTRFDITFAAFEGFTGDPKSLSAVQRSSEEVTRPPELSKK